MPRQVDVASGGLCERKEFSRRILPLRSAKRLLEKAPSIYYRLAKRFFSGLSIECCLGAQRHRRLIRPSPFSIPQIAGQGAGRASRALPRYRLPWRFAGVLPTAREESQRLSGADFPDQDFWTGMIDFREVRLNETGPFTSCRSGMGAMALCSRNGIGPPSRLWLAEASPDGG